MSITLSALAKASLAAQESGEVWVHLIQLVHADLSPTLRYCDDDEDVTHGGNLYTARAFDLELPTEGEGSGRQCTLRLDDVDRYVRGKLAGLLGPVEVTLRIILKSDPTVLLRGPFVFELQSLEKSPATLEGKLVYQSLLDEQVPKDRFTPANCPALFAETGE